MRACAQLFFLLALALKQLFFKGFRTTRGSAVQILAASCAAAAAAPSIKTSLWRFFAPRISETSAFGTPSA